MTTIVGRINRRRAPWYERGGKNKIGLELADYPSDRYGRFAWRHSWPIDAAEPSAIVVTGPRDAPRRVTLHDLIFGRRTTLETVDHVGNLADRTSH